MTIRRFTALALLVAVGAVAAACGDDPITIAPSGRTLDESLEHDGTTRQYRLFVPALADTATTPLPLLIAFHDTASSGSGLQSRTGFDGFAETLGFYVAYPNSLERDWAEGCDCSAADLAGVSDTGFVRALIADVDAAVDIDLDRVYAVGVSQGGAFVWRLACQLTDRFAAVTSVIAPMSVPLSTGCSPSAPIAVLDIQGTEDNVYPYDGGRAPPFDVLGAEETVEFWAAANNCPDTAVVTRPPDVYDDTTFVTVYRYTPCDGGTESILLSVMGGEHAYAISAEFNTTLTIVGFLLEHQR